MSAAQHLTADHVKGLKLQHALRLMEQGDHPKPLPMWTAMLRQSEVLGFPPQKVGYDAETGLRDTYFDLDEPPEATTCVSQPAKRGVLTQRDSAGYALHHPDDLPIDSRAAEEEGIAIEAQPYLKQGQMCFELADDEIDPEQDTRDLQTYVRDALAEIEDPRHPLYRPSRALKAFLLRDTLHRWSRRR